MNFTATDPATSDESANLTLLGAVSLPKYGWAALDVARGGGLAEARVSGGKTEVRKSAGLAEVLV
jgi:hypothetical protein